MNKTKFSLITICFNSAATIERTINSVLLQTNQDFEYIIVDGGSHDKTIDIVKKYESLFGNRLKWTSEPDKGIYDAMNKGIERASGIIIGIVNSDDWLEPDALDNVLKCYEKYDNSFQSVCCGWMNFHYGNGMSQILKTDELALHKKALVYEMGGVRHPATFVPKSVYNKYGLFNIDIHIMADTDFIVRLVKAGVLFIFPNKVLTNMSDGGASNKALMKACFDYRKILLNNNVCGAKFYVLYYKWCIKRFIKGYMPLSLLKVYRKHSNI